MKASARGAYVPSFAALGACACAWAFACGEPRAPAPAGASPAPHTSATRADGGQAAQAAQAAAATAIEEGDAVVDPPSPSQVARVIVETSAQVRLSSRLVADATHLYWYAAGDGFFRLPQAGGTPERVAPPSSEHESLNGFAGNRAVLAWASSDSLAPGNGIVQVLPVGGRAPVTVATGEPFPLAVALDGRHVYWSTMGGKSAGAPSGIGQPGVRRARLSGGAPLEMIAAGRAGVTHLAVDRSHVYFFSNRSTGIDDVVRVPKAGGDVTVLASGQESPVGLAVDATHVYFSVSGPMEMPRSAPCARPPCPVATAAPIYRDGEVRRVPLTGGRVETIASKLKNPRELGLSAGAVYFEDQAGWRFVPKSGGTPAAVLDEGALPKSLRVMAVAYVASEGKVFVIARRAAPAPSP